VKLRFLIFERLFLNVRLGASEPDPIETRSFAWLSSSGLVKMRSVLVLLLATAALAAIDGSSFVSSSGSSYGSGSSGAPTNGVEKCSMSIRGKDWMIEYDPRWTDRFLVFLI
jgi:hypothetical protein